MSVLPKILPPPSRPSHLSGNAKWLSGEGAGSWFNIEQYENFKYYISRYSPEGIVECEGFYNSEKTLNLNEKYKIGYPSHCKEVTVIQNSEDISLMRLSA